MILNRLLILLLLAASGCGGPASEGSTSGTETGKPLGTPMSTAGLSFELPAGWISEIPSSSMRIAQATIPSDSEPGQLTAFFFGPGGGGGVEANLQRWSSQVVLDPGEDEARETFEENGLRTTWVDLSGTLKASAIGSFPTTDRPGYRMFAAVIEGPGGPWFFRAVGPKATLEAEREAFLGMLKSAKAGG